jgi:hypothetical protein
MNKSFGFVVAILLVLNCSAISLSYGQDCGGFERWAVKVGNDPDVAKVETNNAVSIDVKSLNNQPNLQNAVNGSDNQTRLKEERVVYTVSGHLVHFVQETDQDYHLVITDDSLEYTPGGPHTDGKETGTSFIAEIPNPQCYSGSHGDLPNSSVFDKQIREARAQFERCFPNGKAPKKDLDIPVTITGVLFYDRHHSTGQTGRAYYGIELHPVLKICFDDASKCPGQDKPTPCEQQVSTSSTASKVITSSNNTLINPDFEQGPVGWSGTVDDIQSNVKETPHSGNYFAWMGGLGTAHTESLYQQVSISPNAASVKLSFWLSITTDEAQDKAYDKLYVQIRDSNGEVVKTLHRFSNLEANDDYQQYTYDLSDFKGQDIQIYLKAVEDNGNITSFKIDDFSVIVQ